MTEKVISMPAAGVVEVLPVRGRGLDLQPGGRAVRLSSSVAGPALIAGYLLHSGDGGKAGNRDGQRPRYDDLPAFREVVGTVFID